MTRSATGQYSIYFDEKTGAYRGQIAIGKDESGKIKRKYVRGKTHAAVLKKLQKLELQYRDNVVADCYLVTFYQLTMQILNEELELNYIRETTHYRYLETLKQLEPLHQIPLEHITENAIRSLLKRNLHYSQNTINKQFDMLRRTFKEAVHRRLILKNPMDMIRKPHSIKEPTKIRAFSVAEQKRFMTALSIENPSYKNQMLLSLLTGMRMGEINALNISDISFSTDTISITKTMSRGEKGEPIVNFSPKTKAGIRKIPMSKDVRSLLKNVIKNRTTGMLFLTKGKLIRTSQVHTQFTRIIRQYEIIDPTIYGRVDLHSLRHTYATRCIEGGMEPKILQRLLGHSDLAFTLNIYCDVFDAYQNENFLKSLKYLQCQGLTIEDTSL